MCRNFLEACKLNKSNLSATTTNQGNLGFDKSLPWFVIETYFCSRLFVWFASFPLFLEVESDDKKLIRRYNFCVIIINVISTFKNAVLISDAFQGASDNLLSL